MLNSTFKYFPRVILKASCSALQTVKSFLGSFDLLVEKEWESYIESLFLMFQVITFVLLCSVLWILVWVSLKFSPSYFRELLSRVWAAVVVGFIHAVVCILWTGWGKVRAEKLNITSKYFSHIVPFPWVALLEEPVLSTTCYRITEQWFHLWSQMPRFLSDLTSNMPVKCSAFAELTGGSGFPWPCYSALPSLLLSRKGDIS